MRPEERFIIQTERTPESPQFARDLENSKRLTSHGCNGYILSAICGLSKDISRIMDETHISKDSSRSDLYKDSGSIAVAHSIHDEQRLCDVFVIRTATILEQTDDFSNRSTIITTH